MVRLWDFRENKWVEYFERRRSGGIQLEGREFLEKKRRRRSSSRKEWEKGGAD
jgi:hypothetical protein